MSARKQKKARLRKPKTGLKRIAQYLFGNPAASVRPVALRPRIAPGLPLSYNQVKGFKMPSQEKKC